MTKEEQEKIEETIHKYEYDIPENVRDDLIQNIKTNTANKDEPND